MLEGMDTDVWYMDISVILSTRIFLILFREHLSQALARGQTLKTLFGGYIQVGIILFVLCVWMQNIHSDVVQEMYILGGNSLCNELKLYKTLIILAFWLFVSSLFQYFRSCCVLFLQY